MKIGILTFPNSSSHGAALQMFALYHTLDKKGFDTESINYHNAYMKAGLHIARAKNRHSIKQKITQLIHFRQRIGFDKFEKNLVKYPERSTSDKTELQEIGNRYDAVICGSDQVWNPNITDNDLSYFLDFCGQKTMRISYAPSFGVEELSEKYGALVKKELEKFEHLSVREEAGQKIISELCGKQAQLVLDPTMLMDADEWAKYETMHKAAKDGYILYYTVRSSDKLWDFCMELAEKTNLKVLRIGSNIISRNFKNNSSVEYVCDVSPSEWLYLLHKASYVVTNSFHGTAFAINYRKNFFVEFSSMTNSRLSHIINLFGLEKQVVGSANSELSMTTDYVQTELVLPKIRESSMTFLMNALESINKYERKYHP